MSSMVSGLGTPAHAWETGALGLETSFGAGEGLEPLADAAALPLGEQREGRDGQTWEVRVGDAFQEGRGGLKHIWAAVDVLAADSRTRSAVRTIKGRVPEKVPGSRVVIKYLEPEPEPQDRPVVAVSSPTPKIGRPSPRPSD